MYSGIVFMIAAATSVAWTRQIVLGLVVGVGAAAGTLVADNAVSLLAAVFTLIIARPLPVEETA